MINEYINLYKLSFKNNILSKSELAKYNFKNYSESGVIKLKWIYIQKINDFCNLFRIKARMLNKLINVHKQRHKNAVKN